MKKTFVLLITILSLVSCKKELKDYVSLSGQIDGLEANDTILTIRSRELNKAIKIDAKGSFKDTFKLKKADFFSISANRKARFSAYLRNGNDLTLTGDATDLDNTLVFKGEGAATNNYLAERVKKVIAFNKDKVSFTKLDSVGFYTKMDEFEVEMSNLLNNTPDIDTAVVSLEKKGLDSYIKSIKSGYKKQHAFQTTLGKGKASPKFVDFENFKGGKTSLDDLKGKYVYIDVWATWCRPCLGQIPALKELEKEYHGKNIAFVSISTDKPDKHEAWKNMIKSKGMSGIQLYAGKNQSFSKEYQINTIPRFIFIDPNGNIIDANAPRPSQKDAIKRLFSEQGL
jgi:thiol-disulfide isomerase/thioredoxin